MNHFESDLIAWDAFGLAARVQQQPNIAGARMAADSTLTKAELAESLFNEVGLNKREAKELIEAFFALILETLKQGQPVKLSGFGHFQLRDKPSRPGRNLQTGKTISIVARRVVTFHSSQKLKQQISIARNNRIL